MATRSFTDATYQISKKEAPKFRNIMNKDERIKIAKVHNHKNVKNKTAIKKLLGV